VLGREIEEREQPIAIVDERGNRLRIFRAVLLGLIVMVVKGELAGN
jgi:hypothetical protein